MQTTALALESTRRLALAAFECVRRAGLGDARAEEVQLLRRLAPRELVNYGMLCAIATCELPSTWPRAPRTPRTARFGRGVYL